MYYTIKVLFLFIFFFVIIVDEFFSPFFQLDKNILNTLVFWKEVLCILCRFYDKYDKNFTRIQVSHIIYHKIVHSYIYDHNDFTEFFFQIQQIINDYRTSWNKKKERKITVKLLEKESDGEKKKNVTYKINPKLIKYFCCCSH